MDILWSVNMKCNDGGEMYYDEPLYSNIKTEYGILCPLFKTKELAWNYAMKCANDEVNSLNEDTNELFSYGIPDSRDYYGEGGEYIVVNMYELEDENDTTGYTEMITKYWVTPKVVVE